MSTELQTNDRTPLIIAQEINIIRDQAGKILLQSGLEIGKRLKEAKELVGHGNWGTWLETEVNYSQRTAQNLIKIYEEYNEKFIESTENSNTQSFANLSYTQAIAMLKLDSEERETFLEDNDVTSMSTRALEEAIAEKLAIEEEKKKLLESIDKLYEEKENLNKKIIATEELQKKFDDLKAKSVKPEELKKVEKQLSESKAEVDKLKLSLQEERAKVTTVEIEKEVIPKEVTEEMDKMRTKLAMGEDTIKFKATFDLIVKLSNDLFATLANIKERDAAVYEKYKDAFNKVMEKLIIKEGE
jgi:hypothetical protein